MRTATYVINHTIVAPLPCPDMELTETKALSLAVILQIRAETLQVSGHHPLQGLQWLRRSPHHPAIDVSLVAQALSGYIQHTLCISVFIFCMISAACQIGGARWYT